MSIFFITVSPATERFTTVTFFIALAVRLPHVAVTSTVALPLAPATGVTVAFAPLPETVAGAEPNGKTRQLYVIVCPAGNPSGTAVSASVSPGASTGLPVAGSAAPVMVSEHSP